MNGSVTFFPFLLFVFFCFPLLFLFPISFVLEKRRGIESPIIIMSCNVLTAVLDFYEELLVFGFKYK